MFGLRSGRGGVGGRTPPVGAAVWVAVLLGMKGERSRSPKVGGLAHRGAYFAAAKRRLGVPPGWRVSHCWSALMVSRLAAVPGTHGYAPAYSHACLVTRYPCDFRIVLCMFCNLV